MHFNSIKLVLVKNPAASSEALKMSRTDSVVGPLIFLPTKWYGINRRIITAVYRRWYGQKSRLPGVLRPTSGA